MPAFFVSLAAYKPAGYLPLPLWMDAVMEWTPVDDRSRLMSFLILSDAV